MMYTYQSEEAAQQLFSFSNPTNRTTQIFQKLFQSLAGGSSYKVQQTRYVLIISSTSTGTGSIGYSDSVGKLKECHCK